MPGKMRMPLTRLTLIEVKALLTICLYTFTVVTSSSQHGIRITHLDITQPMEGQGPVDMIVHKMTDVVSKMDRGDIAAKEQYDRFMVCTVQPLVTD
jgi:hypothetical protein